jgi:hypothetical protein
MGALFNSSFLTQNTQVFCSAGGEIDEQMATWSGFYAIYSL